MQQGATDSIIFRQLFDKISSTYTYIIGDTNTREAVIVDSVLEQAERDVKLMGELNLRLKYCISTHVHADHVTGNAKLKLNFEHKQQQQEIMNEQEPMKLESVISESSGAKADLYVNETSSLSLGEAIKLNFLLTPGHTNGCMAIVDHKHRLVFTGDTLLIRGCGRTDFQEGNSTRLYRSVHDKLFTLPPDYLVFPAHDYNGRTVTSIAEEKQHNPRLTKSLDEFVHIMDNLNLPKPIMIDKELD